MKRRTLLKYLGAAAAAGLGPKGAAAITYEAPAAQGALATSTPGVFLNQLGYLPAGSKVATVSNLMLDDLSFRVRAMDTGATMFGARLTDPVQDLTSGDRVCLADFSSFTAPGTYQVEAAGQRSSPFRIGPDVYKDALRVTTRAFYGQRCGCKVDLGDGYRHAKCHKHGAFHPSSGKSGNLGNGGGWHDAGDYGRYVVNSGITTATLLWAWELYPRVLAPLRLDIPESGQRLPDFLAEIRWNLDWMLSMQDADGGVWHKQTSEQFCAFIMPEKDDLTSYVIGTGTAPYKSTAATADLAAVAAIAARCYASFDEKFSATCLAAARRAWTWALANPEVTFKNPPQVATGEYGDSTVSDEILWASAELWRTTGEAQFEKQFLEATTPGASRLRIETPGWNNLAPFAYWTYALSDRKGSAEVKESIGEATAEAGRRLVAEGKVNGYGNTLLASEFGWGSNSVAANQSLLLIVAQRLRPNPAFTDTALANLHYLLGRNCHGVSWVTHLGTKPFLNPHHRPSAADHIPAPWPGLLSGGPNSHPGDAVARKLTPGPPMRMWVDDQGAYSMNEVAINWNAPLVFVLAAANGLQS